jgi:AbrB family looped-hinge helix DNA binding protein
MVFVCGLYQTEMAMNTRLTIDRAGRIIIPKPIRKELNLQAGDSLELESAVGGITLRPIPASGSLVKEHGVWVIGSGEPMTGEQTDAILRLIREEREASNLGDAE